MTPWRSKNIRRRLASQFDSLRRKTLMLPGEYDPYAPHGSDQATSPFPQIPPSVLPRLQREEARELTTPDPRSELADSLSHQFLFALPTERKQTLERLRRQNLLDRLEQRHSTSIRQARNIEEQRDHLASAHRRQRQPALTLEPLRDRNANE